MTIEELYAEARRTGACPWVEYEVDNPKVPKAGGLMRVAKEN